MSDDFISNFEKLLERAHTEASEPHFRAITTESGRRALRLEGSFWKALDFISKEYQVSVGEIISCIERAHVNDKNLASAVRHVCIHAMTEQLNETRNWFSGTSIQNLLSANPAPAFVLSKERQIKFTNEAFLKYVRTNFAGTGSQGESPSLRLHIDAPMDDLFMRLNDNQNRPITVGFAIGMYERRVRGNMNAMLAPEWRHQMLLGYVIS
ncbi:ribbon-helix-helix domain-containing protein [Roseibium sp. MMSF_3544]|uniref:ribbon-helix-helix domain-containing protein n=1 Tax=Roseibium sp. MMSF_3544 TaxID=3046723 RepID=UPI00273EF54B|nr:ribbon-helix-helix domain-containing protein [Roseibium sp. MMSF_3544]